MITNIQIRHLLLLLLCLQGAVLHAAENTPAEQQLTNYVQHFATFAKDYPQEKVYLHFDNTAYYLGETMWFKAYVVTAERNGLTQLSKTLYVELLTPEGNILETKKLKIENGQCHGEFHLKDSLYSGFYEVRAYTRYMLNLEKEYLFSRVFPLYENPKKAGDYSVRKMRERVFSQRVPGSRKEYDQKGSLALSFYPEGGNLVSGLKSKVAFKATGKDGENATVYGNVYDAQGASVAELETTFQGMGFFEFTPGTGKYTAKVRSNNKEYTFELPQALPSGYTINNDNTGDENVEILIQKSPTLAAEPLGLSISCRGKLYGSDQVTVGEENAVILSFPKKKLPTGVTQITLYNVSGEVLSERLVFVNHQSQMKMEVMQSKRSYQPFGKVDMDFQLNDRKDKPVETTFSVAVRDASTTSYNPYADNILSNLLLSSEVKGYIENPGYYFESDDPARRQALDLLLLTQGWSRYVWKQMAGVTPYVVKHPIEKSLVIEGTVLSLYKKKPKADVDVMMYLTMPDSTSQRGTCLTDNEGKFNLALTDFNGKAKLILQTKENGKRKENIIQLNRLFSPEMKVYAYQEKIAPQIVTLRKDSITVREDTLKAGEPVEKPEVQAKLPMDKKTHRLKEVTVKGRKKFRREGEGLRKANIVYDVEKTVDEMIDKGEDEPSTVLDYIRQINPYFSFSVAVPDVTGRYKGRPVAFIFNNKPFITAYEQGQYLNDYDRIYLPANEIETVTINEQYGALYKYESQLPRGLTIDENAVLVFIYTYKDFHIRTASVGIRKTKLEGYEYIKEFFNPKYDNVILPDEKDYRRTLYWNPDVKTDAAGKASISFYNNGSCKAMNVSAETVTEKGIIGAVCK